MADVTEFLKIISLLKAGEVRFVIIGGVAMRLQGSAHVTDDINVSYACDIENLQRVVDAFAPHHPGLRGVPADLPFLFDVKTLRNAHNLIFSAGAAAPLQGISCFGA